MLIAAQLSGAPTSTINGLQISSLDANSARLTWEKEAGSDRTLIVMKQGSAPASASDGYKVYNGIGTTTDVHHLLASNDYYFAAFPNNPTYSLGTENEVTESEIQYGMHESEQFIFTSSFESIEVKMRRKSAPGTALATISPTDSGNTATHSIGGRGHLVAFGGNSRMYIYKAIDENNITQLLNHEISGVTSFRASHIDREKEYAYFGANNGNIYRFKLSDLTLVVFTAFAGDEIRKIETDGDSLYVVSNDDNAYYASRADRDAVSGKTIIQDYGVNMETISVVADQLYIGGDNRQVQVKGLLSPFTQTDSMSNPSDDVTSIEGDGKYLSVTDDAGELYVFDIENSHNRLSTISKSHAMEDSKISHGDLYYSGGSQGTSADKFYYRTYLNNVLGEQFLSNSISM